MSETIEASVTESVAAEREQNETPSPEADSGPPPDERTELLHRIEAEIERLSSPCLQRIVDLLEGPIGKLATCKPESSESTTTHDKQGGGAIFYVAKTSELTDAVDWFLQAMDGSYAPDDATAYLQRLTEAIEKDAAEPTAPAPTNGLPDWSVTEWPEFQRAVAMMTGFPRNQGFEDMISALQDGTAEAMLNLETQDDWMVNRARYVAEHCPSKAENAEPAD